MEKLGHNGKQKQRGKRKWHAMSASQRAVTIGVARVCRLHTVSTVVRTCARRVLVVTEGCACPGPTRCSKHLCTTPEARLNSSQAETGHARHTSRRWRGSSVRSARSRCAPNAALRRGTVDTDLFQCQGFRRTLERG